VNFPDDDEPGHASSRSSPLPEGSIPVGVGLLIAGVAIYAFFLVGKRAVDDFAPVTALWFALFALAPGFFLPLEQELGRALSARRARGLGGRPVVRKVALLGLALAGVVVLVLVVLSPVIVEHYLSGSWSLWLALTVSFLTYAAAHLARGIASGTARFVDYAVVLGADGVLRVSLAALVWIVGLSMIGWFGAIIAVSPILGLVWVARRGALRTDDGPPAAWREVTPNLGWLLGGSIFAAGLVNAGPVTAQLLAADSQKELVENFGLGVLLARIPLFMFQAIQAALLPRLARHAARNELSEFRVGLRKLLVVVLVVGVVGTAGAFAVGPYVLRTFFQAELNSETLAMLALGSALYMMALALAQAIIALHGHPQVAIGWGTGMAAFVLVTWLSSDNMIRRIEIGLVASSAAALVWFAVALRSRLRSGAVPDEGSMIEALTDRPFDA
jgi:O-antigen/teichoic acid export membrane protein